MTGQWWLVVCGLGLLGVVVGELLVVAVVMGLVPVVAGWWMARVLRMGVKWDGDGGARWRLWGLVVLGVRGLGGEREGGAGGRTPFEVSRGPAAEELLASPRTAVGC
jgi:hypothetical protein